MVTNIPTTAQMGRGVKFAMEGFKVRGTEHADFHQPLQDQIS